MTSWIILYQPGTDPETALKLFGSAHFSFAHFIVGPLEGFISQTRLGGSKKPMLGILGMVAGIGSLICFIIVLIKQFQDAGVVHGIIGIVTCGIWTLIWGWMNAGRLNIKNIMMIWTLLIVVSMALNILGGGMAFSYGTPTARP